MTHVVDRGLEGIVVGSTRLSKVDGAAGRLTYRGYDVGDLARKASYEEVCYLLLFGTLPTGHQVGDLRTRLAANRSLPPHLLEWMAGLPKTAWPMDVLRTALSALATYAPHLPTGEHASTPRAAINLIAQTPTIVAAWDRIRRGLRPIAPQPDLSTAGNFLYMCSGEAPMYEAEKALDTYLVLLADHSFNASTFAARVTASTRADIYAAVVSAVATLQGDLHGGAPGKVMQMIVDTAEPSRAEEHVREILARGERVMGMGHREYKVRDPRAEYLERTAKTLGEASNPRWYRIARAIEDAAVRVLLEAKPDERLHANVEFYTAPTLYALGIPADEFTCMFACGRMAGWTSHVLEQLGDNRLIRPQATYEGPVDQLFVPLERRVAASAP